MKSGFNHLFLAPENNVNRTMSTIETINEYRKLLDHINAAIGHIDKQMETLMKEYERLNVLHEKVASEATLLVASIGQSARS